MDSYKHLWMREIKRCWLSSRRWCTLCMQVSVWAVRALLSSRSWQLQTTFSTHTHTCRIYSRLLMISSYSHTYWMNSNIISRSNRLVCPGQCVSYNTLNRPPCVVLCCNFLCTQNLFLSTLMLNVGPPSPQTAGQPVNGRMTSQTGAVCRRHGNTHPTL